MRAAAANTTTPCPVPELAMCEKFADSETNTLTPSSGTGGLQNAALTAWNILRVVDTQSWRNCVIVYDLDSWPVLDILAASLSERSIDVIIYDVTSWTNRLQFRHLLEEVWGRLQIQEFITVANITSVEKLFREARAYDIRLGRTSGRRMFSKWIVATSSDRRERLKMAAREFDNVVAILESPEVISLNNSITDSDTVQCITSDVTSLMYVRHGGASTREFQSATVLTSQNDVIVNDSFPNVRHKFNNRTLTVATKVWPPFVIVSNGTNGTLEYTGLCMDMLRELSLYLNFSYVLVEPPWQEGWGDQTQYGNWTGLVGMLERQEADVVIGPVSFSTNRVLVMDATVPFATNRLAAIFRMPDPLLSKWKTYLRPFRGEVLLCLGITLLGITCLVHVMAWINPANRSQQNKKQKSFPGPSPDDGFWYLYGALLSQGGIRLPQSSSARMLISAWWLFSIVIGATYSGNLIAFLTVQIEDKPFETLAELLDQDTYSWGSLGKTSTTMLLMESKNPVLKGLGDGIRERMASDPSVLDLDYQVHHDKVESGGYAFITDSISADAWVRDQCDFAMIEGDGVSMPVDPYAVYLPRHSSFTRLFNDVMRIVEAGLIEKWKRDWWTDSLRCAKSIVTESEPIYVHDVQSVLYAGLVGFGLALLSLGCEFLAVQKEISQEEVSKVVHSHLHLEAILRLCVWALEHSSVVHKDVDVAFLSKDFAGELTN
ncbi:hypothetical protein BaRGS_00036557 [Batillaria attramentaria]|uniref:Uncharacterized protein n=1 Tax=Batillaria attramentaria TaxID=370345 RepID=A0ABD0JBH6_9CAEN